MIRGRLLRGLLLSGFALTPSGKEIDQTTAKTMIQLICDELGVKYNIIKG